MIEIIVRSLATAVLIAGVSVIARRDPALGGLLAVFPTTTSLALIWLAIDEAPLVRMADFTAGVVAGILPTTAILVTLAALLRQGVPLPVSGTVALALWILLTFGLRQLGVLRT